MKSTLRFKFIGIVLIVALPFFVYSIFHYLNTVNENKKTAIRNNFLRTEEIAREIDDFMETSQNILYSLALHPAIINNDSTACDAIFSRLLPLYPYHLNILAADMNGRNIGSAVEPEKAHALNYSDNTWFKRGKMGVSTINDLHISKLFSQPSVMITMPVFNDNGVQTAVLGFPVDLKSFQEHLVTTEALAPNTAITVIDNNGTVIIDTHSEANIGKPYINATIIAALQKETEGSLTDFDSMKTERFYSYATVEISGWKVLMGIPVSEVYAEANRAAMTHFIIFSLICGTGILFSLLYSRRIGHKVELLISGFNEISTGNLDYRVTIAGKDEFAYAAQAFNRMIAERKIAEDEIKNLAASLEKNVAERTAELTNAKVELEAFSYTVSHDLQAPARHVIAYTEMLLTDHSAELSDAGRHHLSRIHKAGENMRQMIIHLLSLSTLNRKELNRSRTDLSSLCRSIISELAEPEPARNVTVSIEDGMFIDADPVLLEIAVKNLLENAWKYTGKAACPCIEIGQIIENSTDCFYVKDNGCGFDMAYADKLFAPFQRLHPEQDYVGSGVGLATVFRIVQRHGGSITAQSTPGNGAVFCFTMAPGMPGKPLEDP